MQPLYVLCNVHNKCTCHLSPYSTITLASTTFPMLCSGAVFEFSNFTWDSRADVFTVGLGYGRFKQGRQVTSACAGGSCPLRGEILFLGSLVFLYWISRQRKEVC